VKLLLALLLLGALAVGGELAVAATAEQQTAERISEALGAPTEVALVGRPVTYWLVVGRIPQVEISARGVPLEGTSASLQQLDATLNDVAVDLGNLVREGRDVPVDTGEGTFTGQLAQQEATQLLGLPLGQVAFADGQAQLRIAGIALSGSVVVEEGDVVVRPDLGALGAVARLALRNVGDLRFRPPLPPGAELQAIEVGDGVLRLRGSIARTPLERFSAGQAAAEPVAPALG
jgi:hypothetical protein